MKFRKKPVTIDAIRWEGGAGAEFQSYFPDDFAASRMRFTGTGSIEILTPEGPMRASPGDWIITGVKGEKYPCKDDIFRLTYEAVED